MNEQAINKLRKKFVIVSTLAFSMVMFFVSGLIFMVNLQAVRTEARAVTQFLVDHNGDLPEPEETTENQTDSTASSNDDIIADTRPFDEKMEDFLNTLFGEQNEIDNSMDMRYATRYFAVITDTQGNVTSVKTNHISSVNEKGAEKYASYLIGKKGDFGAMGNYYYQVDRHTDGSAILVCVDYANQIRTSYRILYLAMIILSFGVILSGILMHKLSFRMVAPEIRNSEQQKAFITNASHELKTPLAVIRANTEADSMINGENEWNTSTMKQVDRMTLLINNLVTIVRAEEKENKQERTDVNASTAVNETIKTYQPVAEQEGLSLKGNVQEDVHMTANESQIRQLATIFLDNAVKYCDKGGTIGVDLSKKGNAVKLVISNDYKEGAEVDYSLFFNRFYRQDKSHNTDKGGFGIGLSIAESLVKQYKGTIKASWKDGIIYFTCILKG